MSDIIRDLQLPRCPRLHPGLPPAPARPPTPLSSHPERGALHTVVARPVPARTKLAPAAAWAQRGLHAGLGPRRLGDRELAGPSPPGLLPATAGALPGDGALQTSHRTPGSPACRLLQALARVGVNPLATALLLSHLRCAPRHRHRHRHCHRLRLRLRLLRPLRLWLYSPHPPVPSPQSRRPGGLLSSGGGELGVSLRTASWCTLPRPSRARGARRGDPAHRGAPNPSPLLPSVAGAYLPESRPWERGSIS